MARQWNSNGQTSNVLIRDYARKWTKEELPWATFIADDEWKCAVPTNNELKLAVAGMHYKLQMIRVALKKVLASYILDNQEMYIFYTDGLVVPFLEGMDDS